MSNPDPTHRPSSGRRRKTYQWGHSLAAKSFRWVALPVMILTVAGLVGFFAAKPAYRAFKLQRAERLARQAETLFEDEKYQDSLKDLGTALLLAPQSFEVNRTAARLYTKIGQPLAMNHWQLVIKDARATREDRLAYLDAAFQVERYDLIAQELGDRNVLDPVDDELLWRKLRYLMSAQKFDDAVEHARVALASKPDLTERELALGEALMRSSRPDQQAEGRRLLLGLALADTPDQVRASIVLRQNTLLQPAEAELIARSLERKPHPTLIDLLEGARLRLAAKPTEKDRIVETLLLESAPTAFQDRLLVSSWLLEADAPKPIASLISQEEAGTNTTALVFRLEALASASDWAGMEPLLRQTNSAPGAILDAMAALREASQKGPEAAEARLRLALDKAGRAGLEARRQLPIVARAAERAGRPLLAVEAYEQLMGFPDLTVPSARQILRLLAGVPNLTRLYLTVTRLHEFSPGDAGIAFEFAYLTILLEKDAQRALRAMEQVPSDHPLRRHLMAFIQSRTAKTVALEPFEEEGAEQWSNLPARWQVVYVDLLGRSQQREAARSLGRKIDTSGLKAEELALLDRWRSQ